MKLEKELYMRRALELAGKGLGLVSPNPMVGCVIVYRDHIIGEGYHHQYGGPHAEVVAVDSVEDKSLLQEATVYVTLEPCSHYGKTPPCCDLLITNGFKKAVIANVDPNPKVQGRGIGRMKEAGIKVSTGLLMEEGLKLNRRFFTFHEKRRPYLILKWAQTADGFIARANFDSKWISGVRSRQLVHSWRAQEDAILVGKNTAYYDNPSLTTRDWSGKDPIRIVLDHKRFLSDKLQLFCDGKTTLRAVENQNAKKDDLTISEDKGIQGLVDSLYENDIQSVIIEGGSSTLQNFIDLELWDEARVFTANIDFKEGIAAPILSANTVNEVKIGRDKLITYENQKAQP